MSESGGSSKAPGAEETKSGVGPSGTAGLGSSVASGPNQHCSAGIAGSRPHPVGHQPFSGMDVLLSARECPRVLPRPCDSQF